MLNGSIKDLPTSAGAEAIDKDAYPARLVGLYDIGTHDGPYGPKRQVIASFELPTEAGEDDDGNTRARILSYWMNVPAAYSEKSKLVQFVDLLSPKGGEPFADLLGRACSVNVDRVEKDGKVNNKIVGVGKLVKGMDVAEATASLVLVTEDQWDVVADLEIADWIKEKINARID